MGTVLIAIGLLIIEITFLILSVSEKILAIQAAILVLSGASLFVLGIISNQENEGITVHQLELSEMKITTTIINNTDTICDTTYVYRPN